jgi:methionine synthase II (cobalamin-independent)
MLSCFKAQTQSAPHKVYVVNQYGYTSDSWYCLGVYSKKEDAVKYLHNQIDKAFKDVKSISKEAWERYCGLGFCSKKVSVSKLVKGLKEVVSDYLNFELYDEDGIDFTRWEIYEEEVK